MMSPTPLVMSQNPRGRQFFWWALLAGLTLITLALLVALLFIKSKPVAEPDIDTDTPEVDPGTETEVLQVPGVDPAAALEPISVVIPESLQVLVNVQTARTPSLKECIIYFTYQGAADAFRFFINGTLIGEGSIEELDIRYSPPYRRVQFATAESLVLPLDVTMESYDAQGYLLGRGRLLMEKYTYHDMD